MRWDSTAPMKWQDVRCERNTTALGDIGVTLAKKTCMYELVCFLPWDVRISPQRCCFFDSNCSFRRFECVAAETKGGSQWLLTGLEMTESGIDSDSSASVSS